MAAPRSKTEETLELSKELLDDIELSRLPLQSLLLKAARLARLLEDEWWQKWLKFELVGYPNTAEANDYLDRIGRRIDKTKGLFYAVPLVQLDGVISTQSLRLQTLRVPDCNVSVSSVNPHDFLGGNAMMPSRIPDPSQIVSRVLAEARTLETNIAQLSGIRARAIAWLHILASTTYHQRAFSSLAESIFDRYKLRVDRLLTGRCSDIMARIPAISARLSPMATPRRSVTR